MKGKYYIQTKQRLWAKRKGLKLEGSQGERGEPNYVKILEENLFESLSSDVKEQFEKGDGTELKSKMRALHSSSAIAVNFFHYWNTKREVYKIAHACRLCRKDNTSSINVSFEQKFEIGKFKKHPNIDVVIKNKDESIYAIECKFTEAYGNRGHGGIKEDYFDVEFVKPNLWSDIPNIRRFAESISPEDGKYNYLHPAQLIKHILGLKNKYNKRKFRLLYLWYDVYGDEGVAHRKEIEEFSAIVKQDGIKFSAISYQKLIANLAKYYYDKNEKYLDYLTDRYL